MIGRRVIAGPERAKGRGVRLAGQPGSKVEYCHKDVAGQGEDMKTIAKAFTGRSGLECRCGTKSGHSCNSAQAA